MDIRPALAIIVAIMVLPFTVIATADLYLEVRQVPTVAQFLRSWSNAYPLFAGFLVIFFGAVLGHLFWH